MTKPFDEPVCPRCGSALEMRSQGRAEGAYCTQCDWSVVTSRMPEFLGDQTQYHVTLVSGDFRDDRHLKAVAQLLGVNRLAARKALEASQELAVFSGLACDLVGIRDALMAVGLEHRIDPPFPW
jgi:hypothetical protein